MVGAGSLTSLKSNSFFSHFNAMEHIKSLFKPRAKLDPKKSEKLQPHASDLEFLDGLRVLSAYTVTVTHLMILGGLIEASIYLGLLKLFVLPSKNVKFAKFLHYIRIILKKFC